MTNSKLRTILAVTGAAVAAALVLAGAAVGTVSDSPFPPSTQPIEQLLTPPVRVVQPARETEFVREDRFLRNDTLSTLLTRLGADTADVARLLADRNATLALSTLRQGMAVQARIDGEGQIKSLEFLTARDQQISVDRNADGFRASSKPAEILVDTNMKSGTIRLSLFGATDAAGVPDTVAGQLAEIFGGDIDFHRDLRRGDRFTVLYETVLHRGRPIRVGRVLAAEFVNQQRVHRAVWFSDAQGKGGYYTPEGKNMHKSFLRSPLEFSRITSGFAMRFHPIFQQWRAHRGVDYGAPAGTRVRSTGEGMVDFIGREGGYGNLVVLRHGGGVTTHYAHLSRFASGLRKGTRVAQGDTIGYVGQTGWATGPHLHYEYRLSGEFRNPLTVAFPAAQPISADRLAAFRVTAEPLAARLDMLRDSNLAALE